MNIWLALRTLIVHTWGVIVSYADVLARNVRGLRSRIGLEQEQLAARMRALGFPAWRRQTVATVERSKRRITAEEILGLSLALGTTPTRLLSPTGDDKAIHLPGSELPDIPGHVMMTIIDGDSASLYVTWDADRPSLAYPASPSVPDVLRMMPGGSGEC